MNGYRAIYGQTVGTEPPKWQSQPQATSLVVLRTQAQTAAHGTLPPTGWSNYIFAVVWKGYPMALAFNYDDVNDAQNALFEAFDPDPYGPPAAPPVYAAVFDATSPKWPLPINEATGPGIRPALIPWGKQTRLSTWRLREGVGEGVVVKRPVHPRVIKEAVRGWPAHLPQPPLPPTPYSREQGVYFLPTGTQAPYNPPPVPGHVYVGYAYGSRVPRVNEWIGPEPLVFVGAALELGQVYFTVVAPHTQQTPTAYVWKWRHGNEWQYLGELPVLV